MNSDASTLKAQRYPSLDALRGLAVLMVVYDHMFAVAGEKIRQAAFAPVADVRRFVTTPLGIVQDFGWLGVCLFFFISGFVIANSARHERLPVFVVRRVFRIFPPLVAAVFLAALLDMVMGSARPLSDYAYAASLVGYFTQPQIVVLGVAWTLVIELLFYLLMGLVSPLLKSRWPATAVAFASAAPLAAIYCARDFGDNFFLLAASLAYVPLLLMGSAIYLRKGLGGPPLVAAALLIFNYGVFLYGLETIHTSFLPIGNSYLVSAVYALGIILLCLHLQPPRALKFVGDISYSLYLTHGLFGFVVVQWMLSLGQVLAAPWVGSVVAIAMAYVLYRVVERPSIAWGKRVAR